MISKEVFPEADDAYMILKYKSDDYFVLYRGNKLTDVPEFIARTDTYQEASMEIFKRLGISIGYTDCMGDWFTAFIQEIHEVTEIKK